LPSRAEAVWGEGSDPCAAERHSQTLCPARDPRLKECYFEGKRNLRESVGTDGQARPII